MDKYIFDESNGLWQELNAYLAEIDEQAKDRFLKMWLKTKLFCT